MAESNKFVTQPGVHHHLQYRGRPADTCRDYLLHSVSGMWTGIMQ